MVGIISLRPLNPFKYLVGDECSLLVQAKKGSQGDGWGVGCYRDGRLTCVIKSSRPVYEEEGLFKALCRVLESDIIIAHVRKASNPRRLPRERLIAVENSQPFHYKNYLFVHNGSLTLPDEVEERLGDYKALIKGVNDSEVYFVYLIKEWEAYGDALKALKAVEEGLWDVWKRGRKGGVDAPYSSLNAIFSDGRRLYAVSRYLEKWREKRSLCYGDSEYFRMAYKLDGESLVVASERTDRGEWRTLSDGEVLIAELKDGRIEHCVVSLKTV